MFYDVITYATKQRQTVVGLCELATALQNQKAISAYFTSKQILTFGFAEPYYTSSTAFETITV